MKFVSNKKLIEGISYDKSAREFVFDYEKDNSEVDHISLCNNDLNFQEHGEFFPNVYYYGYQLLKGNDQVGLVRWLKNNISNPKYEDIIKAFVHNAVGVLFQEKLINIDNYDCIIYPDIRNNDLVEYIIDCISSYLQDGSKISKYQIAKEIPGRVIFDWNLFNRDKNKLFKSKKGYEDAVERIKLALDEIKSGKYFQLHKLRDSGLADLVYRRYFRNFLKFDGTGRDSDYFDNLKKAKEILLVDDTKTTGATINAMIRSVLSINPNCKITIFTLIRGQSKR